MFEELISLFVNLFGVSVFAGVLYASCFLTGLLKKPLDKLSHRYHKNYDSLKVDLIGKGVVIGICLLVCLPLPPLFTEVLDAMMPIGDFEEITAQFADGSGKWLPNVLFEVFLRQFAQSVGYFIPFILIQLLISLVQKFLCGPEENSGYGKLAIRFVSDILLLFAINAMVLRTDMLFPRLMLTFLQSYDLSAGIGKILPVLIPVMLLLFLVFRDLVSSDLLMAILGLNITAAMMDIRPHYGNRVFLFLIAFGCSLAAQLIKHRFPYKDDRFRWELFGALGTLVGTGLVSFLMFSLF